MRTSGHVNVRDWVRIAALEVMAYIGIDVVLSQGVRCQCTHELPSARTAPPPAIPALVEGGHRGEPMGDLVDFADHALEHCERIAKLVSARSNFPGAPGGVVKVNRWHVTPVLLANADQERRFPNVHPSTRVPRD